AVLADTTLMGDRAEIERWTTIHGRLLQASDDEREAASGAAFAALGHPLMQRAAAADECHREVPLTQKLPDGRLLEGIVDMTFREGDVWTVVDFKTDVVLTADARDAYSRQVRLYCRALEEATGQKATGVLLQV
ncbi:MAG: ATP-dependent exoDNAse (exonuclease V) beta subunit, partial [Myxococcota bacterium]